MDYLNFGEKNVDPNNLLECVDSYNEGYVFTRTTKGHMEKVRSVRVDLSKFEQSSENRRILRKYNHELVINKVPFENYSWEIHKLGKDFYDTKFGEGTFSANKIKELFTSPEQNFNTILSYKDGEETQGYCIAFVAENNDTKILHYAYPFYKLDLINSSFGIYMMTKTITGAKDLGFKYIYLGSAHSQASLYKFQFKGVEWFDEERNLWTEKLGELKNKFIE